MKYSISQLVEATICVGGQGDSMDNSYKFLVKKKGDAEYHAILLNVKTQDRKRGHRFSDIDKPKIEYKTRWLYAGHYSIDLEQPFKDLALSDVVESDKKLVDALFDRLPATHKAQIASVRMLAGQRGRHAKKEMEHEKSERI